MVTTAATTAVFLLVALAEWLHARRCRRVVRLAFGPSARPRSWTGTVPLLRAGAAALCAWGLLSLWLMPPAVRKTAATPEGGYRHLLVVLDVSPSMQLKDAGPTAQQTRLQRAGELLLSVLERTQLDQVRISIVAFYTGAKPVVVDTHDLNVVKNILSDLPLDHAFDIGKTAIMAGLRVAADLAKTWQPGSTTLVLVSDGDTVPDLGMPDLPPAISQVLVVGVGNPRAGKFIDGHLSRQDVSLLRQIATRLRGFFHNGNEKHLPSEQMTALAKSLPMVDLAKKGRREWALLAVGAGACLLAGLPLALALAGSPWQAGSGRKSPARTGEQRLSENAVPTA